MTLKLALGLLSLAAFTQIPSTAFGVKGLIVTSSTLDRSTRELKIGLQNTTAKTVVAYSLHFVLLDANGEVVLLNKPGQQPVREFGVAHDYLNPEDTSKYILPGQPVSIAETRIENPQVASVQVDVAGVVYLDRTWEGWKGAAGGLFDGRLETAATYRKSLAEEKHTPAEKARLEKLAAYYEEQAIPKEGK
jgi:hypothetical protein